MATRYKRFNEITFEAYCKAAIDKSTLKECLREGTAKGSGKATPNGVFDWARSGQSGAWGNPNQRFRNIQKDIPETLLAFSMKISAAPGPWTPWMKIYARGDAAVKRTCIREEQPPGTSLFVLWTTRAESVFGSSVS